MNTEDILHLGTLARMYIAEAEIADLQKDISAVLEYVGIIDEVTGDNALTKLPGPVHNVFRDDVVTNTPGSDTAALLAEAPQLEKEFLMVKKILDND